MKQKRGQVTIFVIIAILIVAGIFLFFYVKDKSSSLTPSIHKDIQPVYNYVQNCLKDSGENALNRIGEQGGYFLMSEEVPFIDGRIPYYFYEGKNIMPSKNHIGEEISKQTLYYLPICLNNLSEFKDEGFSFTFGNPILSSKIIRTEIILELDYPITIYKEETAFVLTSFEKRIDNNRLLEIYDLALEIILSSEENNNEICLSCFFDSASKSNLSVSIDQLDYSSLLFTIEYYNVSTNSSYIFKFAGKYGVPNVLDQSAKKLSVPKIPDMKAYAGKEFNMVIIASGYNLSYSDYTPLFEITKTGFITFTPSSRDIGNHSIWITIHDGYGNKINEVFNLEII